MPDPRSAGRMRCVPASSGSEPTYYQTTAIAYPNSDPHLGHAYEYISADFLARFKRLDGYRVRFLTGTDEHGLKMAQAAEKHGVTPAEWAKRNSDIFEELQRELGISFDRFIRTTDPDHLVASQELWRRMEQRGDIYLGTYAGWYSVRDEAYYGEDETEVLDDGEGTRIATASGTPVEWTEEESYFFRLSAYQERLLRVYEEHPEFLGPDARRHEVASFVRSGLQDLSISRTTFDWGIPVPGDERHVMYVWVDALTNYLTGAGFPDVDGDLFRTFWPADLHLIGKDIIRFHAVYWPAFLLSAGIPLPKRVFSHGFLFDRGKKMSKSLGNVVAPHDLVVRYGLDQLRYFLLREVPYGQDGNYSHEAIVGRIDTDLANEFGNLVQRTLTLATRDGVTTVPEPGPFTDADTTLLGAADALLGACREYLATQQIHLALRALWDVLGAANRYFTAQAPWTLRTTDPERFRTVIYVTLEAVRAVATLVQPAMPASAAKVLDELGVAEDARDFAALARRRGSGEPLGTARAVFPRYDG